MGDAAAITLFTNALKTQAPNSSTTLIPPTFDWNSSEQYSDFQLFTKSVKSWLTLQNILKEEKMVPLKLTTRLEYVLNLLGNTGRKKYERWQPSGPDEVRKAKASAEKFMDYLLSTMDHEVSQHCRIYQLEDVRIWAGESPDELVECLHALADHCNFPTDDEKEHNLDALDIVDSKPIHAIHQGKHNKQCQHGAKQTVNQHQCGNCTKSHPLGHASCPAKDATCNKCGKVGHWKPRCHGCSQKKSLKKPPKKGKGRGQKIDNIGTDN